MIALIIILILIMYSLYAYNQKIETFTKAITVKNSDPNKLLFSKNINYLTVSDLNTYLMINTVIDCKIFSFAVSSSSNNSYLSEQLKESICNNVKSVPVKILKNQGYINPVFNFDKIFTSSLPDYCFGLFGMDFLSQYVIHVFYPIKKIGFYSQKNYKYQGAGIKHPIKIINNIVLIDLDVLDDNGNMLKEWFILDIGYPKSFITQKYQKYRRKAYKNIPFNNVKIQNKHHNKYVEAVDKCLPIKNAVGIVGIDFLRIYNVVLNFNIDKREPYLILENKNDLVHTEIKSSGTEIKKKC